MITPPPGWVQHVGAHLVSLYPPTGGARIRFYERLRPPRKFSQVIDTVLARDPLFRVSTLRDARSVVTHEGEYGAWVRIEGTREGARTTRFVGAVFGDEFAAALDAFVLLPSALSATEQIARELLLGSRFALGKRRRRFVYHPPAGWRALQQGLMSTWYPPDFPRNRIHLVVPPAEPTDQTAHELCDVARMLATDEAQGWALDGRVEEAELATVGLTGQRYAYEVRRDRASRRREGVVFVHAGYGYTLRSESLVPERVIEHHAQFLEAARSVVPLPEPGRGQIGVGQDHDGLSHWID